MSQQLTFNLNVDNKQAIDSINTFFDAFDAGVKGVGQKMDQQFKEKNVKIEMRLEGGKLVAKEINNAASAGNKLEKAARVVSGRFGETAKEVNKTVTLLREIISVTKKYKDGSKELSDDWKRLVTLLKEARQVAKDFEFSEQPQRSITGANIAAGLALDAIRALGAGIRNLVSEGVQMEVLMIQLKGFTGSTEAAEAAFSDFLKIAAATPFNVKQVAEAWRTMRGFGVSTEEAKHRVEQLAIVASATGGELNHMARNLGQIQANQRAYTRDLMQFANQGIPIYRMLGEVLGMSTQQIRQLAEEGKIGFNEVAAALDLMTKKGSAFYNISQNMDKTVAARMEALQGTMAATAGKFIEAFQAMDQAMGGPISNTFGLIIGYVTKIGEAFDLVKKNATLLAPIIAAIVAAFAALVGMAIVQNLSAVGLAFTALTAKIMATTAATVALNIAKAILAALTGNWWALAAAAAIGAGAAIYFGQSAKDAAEDTDELNKSLEEESFSASAASAELLAFNISKVSGETKKLIQEEKKRYDEAKKGYDLAMGQAERALAFLEQEATERKKYHEDEITRIKDKLELEKQGMRDAMEAAKTAHSTKMEGLKAELQAVRDRYAEELAQLDKQSVYAKELEAIRRGEIEAKLAAGGLTRKETLELKEQLHQMDNRVKRRELLAAKAAEEKKIQDQIVEAEESHKKKVNEIKKGYESRIAVLEAALDTEQTAIKTINAELDAQAAKVARFKAEELRAIYENRDAAIAALDAQIDKAEILRKKMIEAYNAAKKANSEKADAGAIDAQRNNRRGSGMRFAGGPVSGGSTYTVNELGKEAFLSAAGKLSMINAPSFGSWRAPSSGTVIPAHLTKQLDVPSGGINLNRAAGANAAKAGGGMSGMIRAIQGAMGGDTFHQSVTVQSSNPTQTANNMMVEMTRLRRRRLS